MGWEGIPHAMNVGEIHEEYAWIIVLLSRKSCILHINILQCSHDTCIHNRKLDNNEKVYRIEINEC